MIVSQFARSSVFDPEIIRVMAGAYEEVLDALHIADRNDPLTEVIAKEVIEAARLGVSGAAEMRQRVLNTLGKPQ
jgi:hypothetical protein